MITRFETKVFTWVDVTNPTAEEVHELHTEFKFDISIRDELSEHIERSKVRFFNTHTYSVFQFPTTEGVVRGGKKTEIDFIIGTTFLITVHYENIEAINNIVAETIDTKQIKTTKDLFFNIVYRQYKIIGKQLENMDSLIQETEHTIFGEDHNKTVGKISEINHRILDFKRALSFHKDMWRQFEENILFRNDAERLHIEYKKMLAALEHYQEIIHNLRSTNDSLMTFRTNEIIKLLTVLNLIILVITMLPATLDLIESRQGQFMTIIGFLFASFMIYFTFKKKKWL